MRAVWMVLCVVACGGSDVVPSEFCAAIAERDAACMDEAAIAACESAAAECGDAVLTLESCPLQFSCP